MKIRIKRGSQPGLYAKLGFIDRQKKGKQDKVKQNKMNENTRINNKEGHKNEQQVNELIKKGR